MSRPAFFRSTLLLLAAAVIGCESGSSSADNTPPPKPPTPEERFESIVSALRRHLEDESLGAAVAVADYNGGLGRPSATAKISVESEFIAPTTEDEPYRAVIGLMLSDTKVTVVSPLPSKEDVQDEKKRQRDEIGRLEEELDGVADLDSLIVPDRAAASAQTAGSRVSEIEPEDDKSLYDLEFRDGRWELLTELDRENEPLFAAAMEFALRQQ